jgi:hypothetical protein
MRKLLTLLTLTLAAVSTATSAFGQGERVRRGLGAASYFPLGTGYRWVYTKSGPGVATTWEASVIEAAESVPWRGWHLLTNYFTGPARLVRSELRGRVMEREVAGEREFLWYLLGAPPGTTWRLDWAPSPIMMPIPACIEGSKLRIVGREEVVTVPAGEFHNVVHVEFSSPCVDAGIVGEWFAPGVGLIRRMETMITGPVTSELVHAELGTLVLPLARYETTLSLSASRYFNDLMPPVNLDALPVVRGSFTVRNSTDTPLELTFVGCTSATIEVQNGAGETVVTARTDDGGCCSCDAPKTVTLVRSALVLPFSFKLISDKGMPLADGPYGVRVTLETRDAPSLRPSVRSVIDVASTY